MNINEVIVKNDAMEPWLISAAANNGMLAEVSHYRLQYFTFSKHFNSTDAISWGTSGKWNWFVAASLAADIK